MVKRKRYLAVTLLMLAMAAAIGAVVYGVWSRSAVPVVGTQLSQAAQTPESTEPETAASAETEAPATQPEQSQVVGPGTANASAGEASAGGPGEAAAPAENASQPE